MAATTTETTINDVPAAHQLRKKMGRRTAVNELRQNFLSAVPYSVTFAPHVRGLDPEKRREVENYLRDAFWLWAETWVLPLIDKLEAAGE